MIHSRNRKPIRRYGPRPGTPGGDYIFTYRGKAYSLPGRFLQDPTSPDGRRWIATRESNRVIRSIIRELADSFCELHESSGCWGWTPLESGHAHHAIHKKLGGSFTDDRIWVAGKRIRFWTCATCHKAHHGKLHWSRRAA